MKSKKNKWWNFFKFKFNKKQNKFEPQVEPDTEDDNLWNVGHQTYPYNYRRTFTIKVGNPKRKWWEFRKKLRDKKLKRDRGEREVRNLIREYSEDIDWNNHTGEVYIDGNRNIPYNRQIWISENGNNNNNNNNNINNDYE